MASYDSWVYRRGVLWTADLADPAARQMTPRVPVQFGEVLAGAQGALLAAIKQMDPISPQAIACRFAIGRRCFAGWVNGEIVNYGWLTLGPEWVTELERELHLQAGEAYIWDCATLPEYRHQRLFAALLSYLTAQMRQENMRRLWIIGRSFGALSPVVADISQAGFEQVADLVYGRLFNWRNLLFRPQPGASPQVVSAGRHLLTAEHDRVVGPLITGDSSRPIPPQTHYDR